MGSNLNVWVESIFIFIAVIVMVGLVVTNMNDLYGKSNETPFMDRTDGLKNSLTDFQGDMQSDFDEGDVAFTGDTGITISSSWGIIKSVLGIIWEFVSGNFIRDICNEYLHLPVIIGTLLQILYFIAIGFIVLRILFRINV